MSFHLSAQGIELDGTTLKAELSNVDGDLVECEIELDEILGNDDGSFEWGGEGFAGSASDIELSIEGDEDTPILRAKLSNGDGEEVDADVNLAERIGNNDGSFHFE